MIHRVQVCWQSSESFARRRGARSIPFGSQRGAKDRAEDDRGYIAMIVSGLRA